MNTNRCLNGAPWHGYMLISNQNYIFRCSRYGTFCTAEGSACYIATKAIREIFRAKDNYTPDVARPVHDVTAAHKAMLDYFAVCWLVYTSVL